MLLDHREALLTEITSSLVSRPGEAEGGSMIAHTASLTSMLHGFPRRSVVKTKGEGGICSLPHRVWTEGLLPLRLVTWSSPRANSRAGQRRAQTSGRAQAVQVSEEDYRGVAEAVATMTLPGLNEPANLVVYQVVRGRRRRRADPLRVRTRRSPAHGRARSRRFARSSSGHRAPAHRVGPALRRSCRIAHVGVVEPAHPLSPPQRKAGTWD